MYKISDVMDILPYGENLVFIPFSTMRKDGTPNVPDILETLIPNAGNILSKYGSRDTYYYVAGGNTYMFHRVKSSSKARSVSMDMLNTGLDYLEEVCQDYSIIVVLPSEDYQANEYMKMVFRANNSIYFLEKEETNDE